MLKEKDSDGEIITVGDKVSFSYGIPPVGVSGVLFERDGKLFMPTDGHKPHEETVANIKRYCGHIYKERMG